MNKIIGNNKLAAALSIVLGLAAIAYSHNAKASSFAGNDPVAGAWTLESATCTKGTVNEDSVMNDAIKNKKLEVVFDVASGRGSLTSIIQLEDGAGVCNIKLPFRYVYLENSSATLYPEALECNPDCPLADIICNGGIPKEYTLTYKLAGANLTTTIPSDPNSPQSMLFCAGDYTTETYRFIRRQ